MTTGINRTIQSNLYDSNLLDWSNEKMEQCKGFHPDPSKQIFNPYLNQSMQTTTTSKKKQHDTSLVLQLLKSIRIGTDLSSMTSPFLFLGGKSDLELRTEIYRPGQSLERAWKEKKAEKRMMLITKNVLEQFPQSYRSFITHTKPFNPALGEFMKCSYQMNESKASFVGEQISHHPPVTAVYMENKEQHWRFEAQVRLKATLILNGFKCAIKGYHQYILINEDGTTETYIIDYCNFIGTGLIYGKQAFYPQGIMKIICPETKMESKITFSNKGQSLKGKIFERDRSNKKVFYSMKGNPLNTIQLTDQQTGHAQINWYSLSDIVYYPRIIAPLSKMDPMESRRLWFPTSYYFHQGDETKCLQAKHAVEQRQRERAKKNTPHQYRFFQNVGKKKILGHTVDAVQYKDFDLDVPNHVMRVEDDEMD